MSLISQHVPSTASAMRPTSGWSFSGFVNIGARLCAVVRLCTVARLFAALRGLTFSPPQACDEGLVFRALVPLLPSSRRHSDGPYTHCKRNQWLGSSLVMSGGVFRLSMWAPSLLRVSTWWVHRTHCLVSEPMHPNHCRLGGPRLRVRANDLFLCPISNLPTTFFRRVEAHLCQFSR